MRSFLTYRLYRDWRSGWTYDCCWKSVAEIQGGTLTSEKAFWMDTRSAVKFTFCQLFQIAMWERNVPQLNAASLSDSYFEMYVEPEFSDLYFLIVFGFSSTFGVVFSSNNNARYFYFFYLPISEVLAVFSTLSRYMESKSS